MPKIKIVIRENRTEQTDKGIEDVTARIEAEVDDCGAGNCDALRDRIGGMIAAARHALDSGSGGDKDGT